MHTVSVGIHVCSPVLTTKGPSFTVVFIFRAKFEVAQIPEISLKEETQREGGGDNKLSMPHSVVALLSLSL